MKFIVDAALSPVVAAALRNAGHDAVHLMDYDMLTASDSEVLARAMMEERVIVSADTDFAMLLALRNHVLPSLILFRHPLGSPRSQADRVIAALADIEEALGEGCIVAVEETRMRIRRLPISEYRDT